MGLQLQNNYLLLSQVTDSSSQFVADGQNSNKYQVAFDKGDYKAGDVVYMTGYCEKLEIDGTEYMLAKEDEVVARVA